MPLPAAINAAALAQHSGALRVLKLQQEPQEGLYLQEIASDWPVSSPETRCWGGEGTNHSTTLDVTSSRQIERVL